MPPYAMTTAPKPGQATEDFRNGPRHWYKRDRDDQNSFCHPNGFYRTMSIYARRNPCDYRIGKLVCFY